MEALRPKPSRAPTWIDEWALLRRPASLLLASLAAALLVLAVSGWWRSHAESELAQAQRTRAASAARLFNVGVEKQDLGLYGPRFAQLRAGGMIGDENRLAWIETIKANQLNRRLVSADYEVEPQQAVGGAAPLVLGGLHVRASRMRMNLGLTHELDLFYLLDDLRRVGAYTVQDCQIRKNEGVEQAAGDTARQSASCTLIWLTLGAAPAPAAQAVERTW